ncbi:glycolate oxidase subunit GlcE [Uliginosibacterium sp. sgz301328]|uniref:glycolate oxidase subunit GlcE n=1 Tax=Uliginosibacterium sp. sgz301328 TaxID=3243764 RepID=UPI00359D9C6D
MTGDIEDALVEQVRVACDGRTPLRIRGGGSKDFLAQSLAGDMLDTSKHRGIVAYEPSELVITARAGTPLAEIEAALAEHGQMLAFEPPHFGPATLGGCVASGLSGPARATSGAVRDFVLGVKIIDGQARVLRFGGTVMKNVAGFDVSRLMTGAWGTLGVMLELSIKTLPAAPATETLVLDVPAASVVHWMNRLAGRPLPISATFWHRGVLHVRLSGAATAVAAARREIGGDALAADAAASLWQQVREQKHRFATDAAPLWRLSVRSTADLPQGTDMALEWLGAQRWWGTSLSPDQVRAVAQAAGGHATAFRGAPRGYSVFHPLTSAMLAVQRRIKQAFDPAGIFNPGRIYAEL